MARMAASGLGASAALLAISHNGDDTAGDAAARVADWLGEVVVDMAGGRLEVGRTGAGGVQVNAVRHLPFRPSQIVVRAGFGVGDLIPPATSPFRGVGPSLPGYSPEARFNSATSAFNSATSACSVRRSVA